MQKTLRLASFGNEILSRLTPLVPWNAAGLSSPDLATLRVAEFASVCRDDKVSPEPHCVRLRGVKSTLSGVAAGGNPAGGRRRTS